MPCARVTSCRPQIHYTVGASAAYLKRFERRCWQAHFEFRIRHAATATPWRWHSSCSSPPPSACGSSARPTDMMFDEIYYAKDAKAIVDGRVGPTPPYRWAAGDEVSWPHPEMGKLAIAAGILLFGDRSFGWRLPSVIAGIGLLACVYPLGRRLGLSPPWAMIALLFAAADPLGITQSRIATLDVFIAVWTVLCISWCCATCRTAGAWCGSSLRGAAGGMAWPPSGRARWPSSRRCSSSSPPGAWQRRRDALRSGRRRCRPRRPSRPASATPACDAGPPARPTGESAARRAEAVPATRRPQRRAPERSRRSRLVAWSWLACVALPLAIYLLSYTQYFLAGHTWADLRELHRQMVTFNLHLKATHTYASRRRRGSSTTAPSGTTSRAPRRTTASSPSEPVPVVARHPCRCWPRPSWPSAAHLAAAAGGRAHRRALPAVVPDLAHLVPLLHDAGGAVHRHPGGHGALPVRRRRPARTAAGSPSPAPHWPQPSSGGPSASPPAGCSGRCRGAPATRSAGSASPSASSWRSRSSSSCCRRACGGTGPGRRWSSPAW